jgi:putative hydrolase of the HAD superfamily
VKLTHVLFDFFGTLVEYSPSRTEQGYGRTHALLAEAGADLDYPAFLRLWVDVSEGFDREAERTLREFSMQSLGAAFLDRALGAPSRELVDAFVASYLAEWNAGVVHPAGVGDLVGRLGATYTLAVVTNTHDAGLVPAHLERMDIADAFARVVTSVEHGARKPDPAIFTDTVVALGAAPEECLYVGDTHVADYVGARDAGLRALLIDPERRAPIPEADRIDSIFDLERRLAAEA